jgi:dihydroorotate dehydrogenase (NAD+) catalytic subunit
MALPTPGIDEIVEELDNFVFKTPIIFNIYSHAEDISDNIEEHKMLIKHLAPFRPIAIEINKSCPNAMAGEKSLQEMTQSLEEEAKFFKEVYKATNLPIIAKLSPKGDYVSMAKTIAPHTDYICCGNTYPGTIINAFNGYPVLSAGRGGMSGPAILPINQLMTLEVYQAVGDQVGIIGCGGIRNAEDAMGYIRAGATFVQVGTALAYEKDPIQTYRKLWGDMQAIERKLGKTHKELVGDCHVP